MVCDNPSGIGLEIHHMPDFFSNKPKLETEERHVHAFYEIIYFEDGEGLHYVDFNEYPVKPGTVFFISPGQIHSFDHGHKQKGVLMKICSELMNDESSSESMYLRYNVFNAFDHVPYNLVAPQDSTKLQNIIKSIEEEMNEESNTVGHKEYLQLLIKMFIITVQRKNIAAESVNLNPAKGAHKNFLAFRQLIEDNFTTIHTVKEYASMLNVSTKTLNQVVNECSAYSPLELINNRIVLETKRLLRYSNFTVKEIAHRMGFEDPSYFVKFFKRQVNVSPADYRNAI